jgi:ech hydrogenase subunit D
MEQQTITDVTLGDLLARVQAMKDAGARLVQICATRLPECVQLQYSFDKDFAFSSMRLTLSGDGKDVKVPSMTPVYFNAFHYENEIHDLFGINIEGNLVDYKGNFYRTAVKSAFNCAKPPAAGEAGV